MTRRLYLFRLLAVTVLVLVAAYITLGPRWFTAQPQTWSRSGKTIRIGSGAHRAAGVRSMLQTLVGEKALLIFWETSPQRCVHVSWTPPPGEGWFFWLPWEHLGAGERQQGEVFFKSLGGDLVKDSSKRPIALSVWRFDLDGAERLVLSVFEQVYESAADYDLMVDWEEKPP